MQPEATKSSEAETPKVVSAETPQPTTAPQTQKPADQAVSAPHEAPVSKPAETPVPSSPVTAAAPAMMTTPVQQEAAFQTLKPALDYWKFVWKGLIGLNFFVALLFVTFVILKLTGTANNDLLAGAMGTPFWLMPVILLVDIVAVAVYAFLKRPKLPEVTSILTWLGVSLAAAFLASIGFVIYASIS